MNNLKFCLTYFFPSINSEFFVTVVKLDFNSFFLVLRISFRGNFIVGYIARTCKILAGKAHSCNSCKITSLSQDLAR